jgi:soluble lytic murein transglycosylase-like protein
MNTLTRIRFTRLQQLGTQTRILLALGAVLLVCAMLPASAPVDTVTTPQAPQAHAAKEIETPKLSDADAAHYRAAFADIAQAEFAQANAELQNVEKPILIGHALAEIYLHEESKPNLAELQQWLQNYGDHPQAYRIAKLAARKGANIDARLYHAASLKGDGLTEHLGRKSPPATWYQGLTAWRKADYANAAPKFEAVGSNAKLNHWHRAAGYYWAFRSYARAGNMPKAEAMLHLGRSFPHTFYGMLATVRLGETPTVIASAPYVPNSIANAAASLRARALTLIGNTTLAEAELRQFYMALPEEARPAVLALAGDLGLANLQIRLRKTAGLSHDEQLFAAFPVPGTVVNASLDINPALVLAVARQESAFRAHAGSEAGARGMMQVMPTTANAVMGSDAFKTSLAFNSPDFNALGMMQPDMNIRIGASYLSMLQKKPMIKGSLIHTLAAYNAGPGSVAAWQKAAKNVVDPLLYVESIPYPETRNYVIQVLAHYVIYQQMLGQNPELLAELAQGQWPVVASAN